MITITKKQWEEESSILFRKETLQYLEKHHPKVFDEIEDMLLGKMMEERKNDFKNKKYISSQKFLKKYDS